SCYLPPDCRDVVYFETRGYASPYSTALNPFRTPELDFWDPRPPLSRPGVRGSSEAQTQPVEAIAHLGGHPVVPGGDRSRIRPDQVARPGRARGQRPADHAR